MHLKTIWQLVYQYQSGGFVGSLLSKLADLLLKVTLPLSKIILVPLGITAAASAIDAGIPKKIYGSGTTTLIISNEEMNDIMKIFQALEDSNIFLKGVNKTIKNETKGQKLVMEIKNFNFTSSFNRHWNTRLLTEWTQIEWSLLHM